VIGVDDFALRKRQRYATVIIDAVTGDRVDVLADRTAATLETWLRDHPGVRMVCRDGSGAYAEAIRRALPNAMQVADRWQCAMRRLVVYPVQPGGTRREVSGSDGLPGAERRRGQQHAIDAAAMLRRWRRRVVGPA
jgi:hypothetical protein